MTLRPPYIPLGKDGEPDGLLIFRPHLGGADSATFDVHSETFNEQCLRPDDYRRQPRVFNNITREQARQLRDALNTWLGEGDN